MLGLTRQSRVATQNPMPQVTLQAFELFQSSAPTLPPCFRFLTSQARISCGTSSLLSHLTSTLPLGTWTSVLPSLLVLVVWE